MDDIEKEMEHISEKSNELAVELAIHCKKFDGNPLTGLIACLKISCSLAAITIPKAAFMTLAEHMCDRALMNHNEFEKMSRKQKIQLQKELDQKMSDYGKT